MKEKILTAIVIVLIIVVAAALLVSINFDRKTEQVEATVAPTSTVDTPKVNATAVPEENTAVSQEETSEVPEIGSTSNPYGWTIEGETVPEITSNQNAQAYSDAAAGENETVRVSAGDIEEIGDEDEANRSGNQVQASGENETPRILGGELEKIPD